MEERYFVNAGESEMPQSIEERFLALENTVARQKAALIGALLILVVAATSAATVGSKPQDGATIAAAAALSTHQEGANIEADVVRAHEFILKDKNGNDVLSIDLTKSGRPALWIKKDGKWLRGMLLDSTPSGGIKTTGLEGTPFTHSIFSDAVTGKGKNPSLWEIQQIRVGPSTGGKKDE